MIRHLESYLVGSVRCTDGTSVVFVPYPDDDDGAGDREPRRPKPHAPGAGAAAQR